MPERALRRRAESCREQQFTPSPIFHFPSEIHFFIWRMFRCSTSQGSGLVFGFRAAVSVRSQQEFVPKCMRARPDASTSAHPIP